MKLHYVLSYPCGVRVVFDYEGWWKAEVDMSNETVICPLHGKDCKR